MNVMIEICRLCEEKGSLRVSHIIPKFVFGWLKKTSATGKIRRSISINKRVQDGLKLPWLCIDCEMKFSRWERYFAQKIFYPLINNTDKIFYDSSLLKFCVSISWRVLQYQLEENNIIISEQHAALVNNALAKWRAFMFDECDNPGSYEQHVYNISFEILTNHPTISPNIHRYLQRSIDIDVITNDSFFIVYTKLPSILLIGYIGLNETGKWRETRVHVKEGMLSQVGGGCFPIELWNYIKMRADMVMELKNSISDTQVKLIDKTLLNNTNRTVKSDTWKALERDILLFGSDEVFKKSK
jgi:hypothetical protein